MLDGILHQVRQQLAEPACIAAQGNAWLDQRHDVGLRMHFPQFGDHLGKVQFERTFVAQLECDAAEAAACEVDHIIDQARHPADAAPHALQDAQHGRVPGFRSEQVDAMLKSAERRTQVVTSIAMNCSRSSAALCSDNDAVLGECMIAFGFELRRHELGKQLDQERR